MIRDNSRQEELDREDDLHGSALEHERDPDPEPIGTCCGSPITFDPEARGETCGGLALKGWNICGTCGAGRLVKGRSVEDRGETDEWRLAKGGRSLACGAIKLRAEKGDSAAIEALMSRIARLPELEAEVTRLRAELETPCPHRKP